MVIGTLPVWIFACGVSGWDAFTKNRAETSRNDPDPRMIPRLYPFAYETVFQMALDVAASLPRWRVVRHDIEKGRIDAERQTRLFKFVDDIEIHFSRDNPVAIEVNLLSKSRVGKGDFGQNRRNILEFLTAMDQRVRLMKFKTKGADRDLSKRLEAHVTHLALTIGERHFRRRGSLNQASDYIFSVLEEYEFAPVFETFDIKQVPWLTEVRTSEQEAGLLEGTVFRNVVATHHGATDEVVVVGAHYDTVAGSPGADDNASGIAVLLELAREIKKVALNKTITFVAFANEEPPFFRTSAMGSAHFVESARTQGKKMTFMLSLEMLGFYSEVPGSQTYPPFLRFFYPHQANFIAVTGNLASRAWVSKVAHHLRATIPVEALAAPRFVPGIDFSDQLNFWRKGIPAVMITDTAFYRNPHYHQPSDLPRTLQFDAMTKITEGLLSFLIETGRQ